MKKLLLCIAIFMSASFVSAHTDEYLDTVEGAHGGQIRMSGAYHFELVVDVGHHHTGIKVYLGNHAWEPVSAEGVKAEAIISSRGQKSRVVLDQDGQSSLSAMGNWLINEETIVHLKVKMPNGDQEMAKFQPMKKPTGNSKTEQQTDSHDGHH